MAARRHRPARVLAAFALLCVLVTARRSGAVMDIEDRGPVLRAGRFTLRVSNVGVLGILVQQRTLVRSLVRVSQRQRRNCWGTPSCGWAR